MREAVVVAARLRESHCLPCVYSRLPKVSSGGLRHCAPRERFALTDDIAGALGRLLRLCVERDRAFPLALHAVAVPLFDQSERKRRPICTGGEHAIARGQLGFGLRDLAQSRLEIACLAEVIDDSVKPLNGELLELERIALRGRRSSQSKEQTQRQTPARKR